MTDEPLRKALYYPHIVPPSDRWINNVLLYWDKVALIVPTDLAGFEPEEAQRLNSLIASGLVEVWGPDKLKEVQDYTLVTELKRELKGVKPTGKSAKVNVNRDKFGAQMDPVMRLLHKRNLGSLDGQWFHMDEHAARLVMMVLARRLLAIHVEYQPVTDNPMYLRLEAGSERAITDPLNEETIKVRLERHVIRDVIPLVSGAVAPEALAEFKTKHCEDLRRFRQCVDKAAAELMHKNLPDPEFSEAKAKVIRELIEERNSLTGVMGFLGATTTANMLTVPAAVHGSVVAEGVAEQLAALAAVGMVIAGALAAGAMGKELHRRRSSELRYAMLVGKKLG
jgi:hypothetical protein